MTGFETSRGRVDALSSHRYFYRMHKLVGGSLPCALCACIPTIYYWAREFVVAGGLMSLCSRLC